MCQVVFKLNLESYLDWGVEMEGGLHLNRNSMEKCKGMEPAGTMYKNGKSSLATNYFFKKCQVEEFQI